MHTCPLTSPLPTQHVTITNILIKVSTPLHLAGRPKTYPFHGCTTSGAKAGGVAVPPTAAICAGTKLHPCTETKQMKFSYSLIVQQHRNFHFVIASHLMTNLPPTAHLLLQLRLDKRIPTLPSFSLYLVLNILFLKRERRHR